MDGSVEGCKNSDSDLIDLNCSDTINPNIALPLIPCPQSAELTNNCNPFDEVAVQTEYHEDDPFEMVFKSAFCTQIEENAVVNGCITKLKQPHGSVTKEYVVESNDQPINVESFPAVTKLAEKISTGESVSSDPFETGFKIPCSTPCKKGDESKKYRNGDLSSSLPSPSGSDRYASNEGCDSLKPPIVDSSNSSSQSSMDDEALKATVRERIQNIFNNKNIENLPPFSDYLRQSKTKHYNRRSLPNSFRENSIGKTEAVSSIDLTASVRESDKAKCDKLKLRVCKSIDNSLQNQYTEESEDFNKAFMFNWPSANSNVTESKKELDFSFEDPEGDVFVVAKKLAQSFNESAPNLNEMGLNDDLMSWNPKLDPVDSSDEEWDELHNDPALNMRFSSLSMEQLVQPRRSVEFSDAVVEYAKIRSLNLSSSLSLDCSGPTLPEMGQLKKSHSFSGMETPKKVKGKLQDKKSKMQPRTISDCLIKKQPGVVPVAQEKITEKLKVKKTEPVMNKRGPLKAIIPIQNMTRQSLNKNCKKNSPKQMNVPGARGSAATGSIIANKKNQRSFSPIPVASSTPNKNISIGSSPSSSPILKINKPTERFHRSLDSFDNLKNTRRSSSSSRITKGKENQSAILNKRIINSPASKLTRMSPKLSFHSSQRGSNDKENIFPA